MQLIKGNEEQPATDKNIFIIMNEVVLLVGHYMPSMKTFFSHETPVKYVPLDIDKLQWIKM